MRKGARYAVVVRWNNTFSLAELFPPPVASGNEGQCRSRKIGRSHGPKPGAKTMRNVPGHLADRADHNQKPGATRSNGVPGKSPDHTDQSQGQEPGATRIGRSHGPKPGAKTRGQQGSMGFQEHRLPIKAQHHQHIVAKLPPSAVIINNEHHCQNTIITKYSPAQHKHTQPTSRQRSTSLHQRITSVPRTRISKVSPKHILKHISKVSQTEHQNIRHNIIESYFFATSHVNSFMDT